MLSLKNSTSMRNLIAVICVASFSVSAVVAATPEKLKKDAEVIGVIEQAFSKKFGSKPTEVTPTAIPGIYQIYNSGHVSYSDASGRYHFEGALYDNVTGDNVANAKIQEVTLKAVKNLDIKDAIKITSAKGKNVIYTFEDANCGYCRKLSSELLKLKDVTVYTFPLQFLGPQSGEKAKAAWCAKDRTAAWLEFMGGRESAPTDTSCDTSMLERNAVLARSLGVSGTPTIVFKDGSRIGGYTEAANIEKHLASVK